MRKVREILRLKFEGGLSNRAIARSVSLSPTSVSDCLLRCSTAGIAWPLDPELDDARLEAKVENGVLLAQRWILATLRNHQFFSVAQANEAIAEKLEELNDRKFQLLDTTRRTLYESLDRPALKPLPQYRYELAQRSEPRVNIDYHVDVERHYYSVPYTLIHKKVDARRTATTVEIFFKNRRVASH